MATDHVIQNLLVDVHEKAPDIFFQVPCRATAIARHLMEKGLQTVYCPMNPLVPATGIGIVDKQSFKLRFKVTHQQMVDHPVSKICGKDFPQFRFLLHKADGSRGVVGAAAQFIVEVDEVVQKRYLKFECIDGIALVLPALQIGIIYIFQRKQG